MSGMTEASSYGSPFSIVPASPPALSLSKGVSASRSFSPSPGEFYFDIIFFWLHQKEEKCSGEDRPKLNADAYKNRSQMKKRKEAKGITGGSACTNDATEIWTDAGHTMSSGWEPETAASV